MAKILVADDNSNIQRMVGLALKDQGIDVVAVGNGEAAVKKILEIRPDLVLADVFMPVRNGYEVCEYVKEDPSLKHIPVILLVGAFDPLDEQEAQRVGADGVLKKPFVPPDPLIVMVKSALQRAGVSTGKDKASASSASGGRKAAEVLPFAPATPVVTQPAQVAGSPLGGLSFSGNLTSEALVNGDESFVGLPTVPEPVKLEVAEQTMAFGDLMGPTTIEETEFTSEYQTEKTGPGLTEVGEAKDVAEEEGATESAPSWRREEAPATASVDKESGPVQDWRDSPVLHTTGRKSARELWEEKEEKGGFVSAAEVPADMGAFVTEINNLESESLNAKSDEGTRETRVEEEPQTGFLEETKNFPSDDGAIALTEEPEFTTELGNQQAAGNTTGEGVATVQEDFVGAPSSATKELVSQALPEIAHLEEAARQEAVRQEEAARQEEIDRREEAARQEEIARQEEAARQEEIARREEATRQEEIARQEEAARQEEIARQEEAERQEEIAREEAKRQEEAERQKEKVAEAEPVNSWFSRPASPWNNDTKRSNPWAAVETEKTASMDSVDTARTATSKGSDASHRSGNGTSDALATVISDLSAAEVASTRPTATQSEVDAVVAKVLAKLSPEVMQAVTRELLKPVIASLVEDELKSKK